MEHIADKWSMIWCPGCGDTRKLLVDEMLADERNDHDALDLICDDCKLVITTLHAKKS